jgi:hypothetical protein
MKSLEFWMFPGTGYVKAGHIMMCGQIHNHGVAINPSLPVISTVGFGLVFIYSIVFCNFALAMICDLS